MCFSVYAYEALKRELEKVKELRFFPFLTFLPEETPRERREFYIPRLSRERVLHGSEFEISLRNAFTPEDHLQGMR